MAQDVVAVGLEVSLDCCRVLRVDASFLDGLLRHAPALDEGIASSGAKPTTRNGACCVAHKRHSRAGSTTSSTAGQHANSGRDHVGRLLNNALTHRAKVSTCRTDASDHAWRLTPVLGELARYFGDAAQHAIATLPRG